MQDRDDSYTYHDVTFSPESIHLFVNALRYYAARLEEDVMAITIDPELAKLLDDKTLKSFRISREIKDSRIFADRFEAILPNAESMGDAEMTVSHGLVRRLKAVGALYLNELEARRNKVATERSLTTRGLEALDTKLAKWREMLDMGVFWYADAAPLLVSDLIAAASTTGATADTSAPTANGATAPLKIATTIEIVDAQLRDRCLDLFDVFDQANQPHRFDTVITEATRVLEDRIRTRASLGSDMTGVELMSAAFGSNPKLRLSTQDSEQQAAHLLFRGAFGFIRNPVHHRLVDQLPKQRVIQILGFVDYLVYLAETATKV